MAKKNRLTQVAARMGAAMGRADRTVHKVAKEELKELSKQVEALKQQLQKTTKRLKRALR
jgi:hypothetical protein